MAATRTIYVKGDPDKKGLDYEKDYIDFSNKPQWLFERVKDGTVPVLNDGGKWVPDSGDICAYLDATYPPSTGDASLDGIGGQKLLPAFKNFLTASDAERGEKEAALLEQLQQLETHLAGNGPFLAGSAFGAADALVVPRLYHLSEALPHFKQWSVPEDKFPAVVQYLAAAKETQAFKNTYYSPEQIIAGWSSHVK